MPSLPVRRDRAAPPPAGRGGVSPAPATNRPPNSAAAAGALRSQNVNNNNGGSNPGSRTNTPSSRKPGLPPAATSNNAAAGGGSQSRRGSSNRPSANGQQQQAALPRVPCEIIAQLDAAIRAEQELLRRAEECIPELEAQLEGAIEQRDAELQRVRAHHERAMEAIKARQGDAARDLAEARHALGRLVDEESAADERITLTYHQIAATREDGVKLLEQRAGILQETLESRQRVLLEEREAEALAREEEREAGDMTVGLGAEEAGLVRAAEAARRAAAEAHGKALELEMTRRRLNAKYEEIKGTIRVYCRVKGVLNVADLDEVNRFMVFPDSSAPAASSSSSSSAGGSSVVSTKAADPASSSASSTAALSQPFSASASAAANSTNSNNNNNPAAVLYGSAASSLPTTAGRKLQVIQSRDNATSTGRRESQVEFDFDRVFGVSATQTQIFEECYPMVDAAVDGYRTVVFSYGASGSGKSYTIEGTRAHPGLIPRSIDRVFSRIRALQDDGWVYEIKCSFIEIYNETIRDLLNKSSVYQEAVLRSGASLIKHEIVHTGANDNNNHYHGAAAAAAAAAAGGGGGGPGYPDTYITGIEEKVVTTPQHLHSLLETARANRAVAATQMNERSSRSHCVFTMRVLGHNTRLNNSRSSGILCLIDLAGSEKLKQSGATNQRQTEAIAINSSLSHLKTCISALSNRTVVPWQKSKLTYLLQNYLQGEGAKMLMFVTVSNKEEHVKETINSLRFATDVNQTRIGVAKQQLMCDAASASAAK